ncbi:MAG: hypothetical protein IPP72_14335 [Chitinophagaceae bacterium]|nr:hypothetical protein [Chitinophagaceae bacterium]
MFTDSNETIVVLIICVILLVAILSAFIITIIYKYQKRQIKYFKEIEELKSAYKNTLLQSQLEMQEYTFQHIAREIHDNIGQKLTLAKLYLNTLSYCDTNTTRSSVNDSLELITESISGLSDVSRSMSTEMILQNGLVKGIEMEVANVKKAGLYQVAFNISGNEIFLSGNAELVIFRIVQECLNNFLKHADGNYISIGLNYTNDRLILDINDNGKGFDIDKQVNGAGLINIRKRAVLLKGDCKINSCNKGTSIIINIPINENTEQAKANIG